MARIAVPVRSKCHTMMMTLNIRNPIGTGVAGRVRLSKVCDSKCPSNYSPLVVRRFDSILAVRVQRCFGFGVVVVVVVRQQQPRLGFAAQPRTVEVRDEVGQQVSKGEGAGPLPFDVWRVQPLRTISR